MNTFKNLPNKKAFEIKKLSGGLTIKERNKVKTAAVSLLIFMTLFMLLCGIYGVYSFFNTYGLQIPIILRSPIYHLKQNVIISPVGSPSAQIRAEFDLGAISDKIYTLESSNGKNDGCRRLGLFNGYGFRQNSFEWICYNSHEEVRQHVINWLTEHIKNGDIESALCMYNEGKTENGCTYAMNYKSL